MRSVGSNILTSEYAPMRAKRVVTLLLCLIPPTVATLPAQLAPGSTRTVAVTVIDRDGNPLSSLTAAEFRAQFRGRSAEISSARVNASGGRVVRLLDASSSMKSGKQKWEAAQAFAENFVRLPGAPCSTALIIFASKVLDRVGFLEDPSAVADRLASLRQKTEPAPKGQQRTALYDAISAGTTELSPSRPGDMVYVITDAGDNTSKEKASPLERTLLSKGIRLFVFPLRGYYPWGLREFEKGTNRLEEMVKATGGNIWALVPIEPRGLPVCHYWRSEKEREAVFATVLRFPRQIKQYYLVDVKLPSTVDKPENWKMEVVDERGTRRKDVAVLYPRRLMLCRDADA
jgi:hypothetical protein